MWATASKAKETELPYPFGAQILPPHVPDARKRATRFNFCLAGFHSYFGTILHCCFSNSSLLEWECVPVPPIGSSQPRVCLESPRRLWSWILSNAGIYNTMGTLEAGLNAFCIWDGHEPLGVRSRMLRFVSKWSPPVQYSEIRLWGSD
jgi:hypothetical protein